MQLQTAINIAKDCDLTTIGEAIYNIRYHAMSIFTYGEEQKEYDELIKDFRNSGLTLDDKISCYRGEVRC